MKASAAAARPVTEHELEVQRRWGLFLNLITKKSPGILANTELIRSKVMLSGAKVVSVESAKLIPALTIRCKIPYSEGAADRVEVPRATLRGFMNKLLAEITALNNLKNPSELRKALLAEGIRKIRLEKIDNGFDSKGRRSPPNKPVLVAEEIVRLK